MVIGRRSLLLAGVSLPAASAAFAQCVTDALTVDACLGGVRLTGPSMPPGATLNLNFLTGVLDPLLTFTRASTGTYFDSGGVMRTAGLNLVFPSVPDAGSAWALSGPIAKGGSVLAPDGTTSTTSLALATNTANATRAINVGTAIAANAIYTVSVFLKGGPNNGYIQLNVNAGSTFAPVAYYDLTAGTAVVGADLVAGVTTKSAAIVPAANGWYRASFTFTSPAATTGVAAFIGPCVTVAATGDNRAYPGVVGQGVYVWGLQIELGPVATQYAPTTTVANSSPRWDYDPVSLQLRGLLLEDQRTNLTFPSGDVGDPLWLKSGAVVTAPVVTSNQTTAPDGTTTAARVVYPAVTGAGALSFFNKSTVVTVAVYTFSVWLRGNAGGEQLYLSAVAGSTWYSSPRITLTTQWRRYVLTTSTLSALGWAFCVGTDLRDTVGQTSTTGGTVFAWGMQLELGDFPTSFIPTTLSAAVTRSIDSCLIPPANMSPWFAPPGGSWFAEFDYFNANPGGGIRIVGRTGAPGSVSPALIANTPGVANQFDAALAVPTVNTTLANTIAKIATSWAAASARVCMNGGAITTSALLATGYGALATSGTSIMQIVALSATNVSGHIRRVQYYPRVLADAEMQSLTTITDPSLFLNFMNPNTLDPRIAFTRASTATYTDVNGVLQTANNDTPRWDYDPVTHALRGLLIEEARTNNLWPSIPVAGSWGQTNLSIVSNIAVAPDGSTTFAKLVDTATTGPHYSIAGPLQTLTASQSYTFSIHAKAGENRYLQLIFDNNGATGTNATFDLQTGTITGPASSGGGATGSVATMIALGNGVYRCTLTSNLGANTTGRFAVQHSIVPSPGAVFGGNPYTGVAGNGLFVWGAQVELGAFPTSYIPTTGSTVTRGADVCQITSGNMGWYSAAASSLFGEFYIPGALPSPTPNVRELCGLSDGTTANRLVLRALGALSSNGVFYSSVTGTNNVSAALPALTADAVSKQAAAWNGTTGHGTTNGGAIVSVNSALPGGINLFMIGNNSPGANATISGYVRAVRYWPRVLSDAEMQQVTT